MNLIILLTHNSFQKIKSSKPEKNICLFRQAECKDDLVSRAPLFLWFMPAFSPF